MSDYFVLRCEPPYTSFGEALVIVHNRNHEHGGVWGLGNPLTVQIREPLEFKVQRLRGFQGRPDELLDLGTPIMSERLALVLSAAGVSRIEYRKALLVDDESGVALEYRAFNLLDVIAAADLSRSISQSYDHELGDTSFVDLALDDAKARGAPMFRLAENLCIILVHRRVKDAILAAGIDTLEFVAPEDVVQL